MSGVKGGQTVMVTGRIGLGKDEDGGLGGGSYGGGGGDGQGGDGDGLNMWEDTVVNIILGTETSSPIASIQLL